MSRTKRGSKGIGYDYWGRRALSGDCGHGKEVKKITHRIERAREREMLRREEEEFAAEEED
jgi:hypothetical protein